MLRLVRAIERLSELSGSVIAWLVFPLIIATCFEVFSRYVLNAPTIWAFEAGYMAMGVHALIGAAYTLKHQAHIRIDVLYSHFRDRTKAIIDIAGYLILFFPVVIWLNIALYDYWLEAFLSGEQSGQSAWNPIIWPFRATFFIGYALLLLQGIAELLKNILVVTGRGHLLEGDEGEQA